MDNQIAVRAIQSQQGDGLDIYSFFILGNKIMEIADISRIEKQAEARLEGFQRQAIKNHVNSIVEYLDQGNVFFPNAITLGISPEIEFKQSRGRDPEGAFNAGNIGTLYLPIRPPGDRVAWIVDGQQRSLALSQSTNREIAVPVVAFVAKDLDTLREQFVLLNKGRPLPVRLINELLPEIDKRLPKDLTKRKVPSAICNLLNEDPESPFHGLIKRSSSNSKKGAVVTDTAIMEMIQSSLTNPIGALAQYASLGDQPADIDKMYETLVLFWTQVKQIFESAWGLPPTKSRLMHGAGIKAMGFMMDRLIARHTGSVDLAASIGKSLEAIAPNCCWIDGTWPDLQMDWNEIQNVSRHVKALSDQLLRLDNQAAQKTE